MLARPVLTPKRSSTAPATLPGTPETPIRKSHPPIQPRSRDSKPGVHPLQDEIDRLMAACDEHERKIRATKSSIEHRLYNELPHVLTRLNEVDVQAENTATSIQSAVDTVREPIKKKLGDLVAARERDVETMRARTTPWRSFFEEEEENGLGTKITRVAGAGAAGDDSDGLARIEKWAEEVEIYLSSEIIRLKAAMSSKSRRKSLLSGLISFILMIIVALIGIGWAASRKWG
ncbi:hypothetical protein BD324DRAFT_631023 [Kockovaella imperatae]|uniref:Uncharacterized protein n=1 Tax=Kockovaella imperatae TaxID=4999 RepID=A0A1Y1UC86_9TREE|nr:hypothetical protein BD324DRAFT_631023 [Kockovaella imperatae]ORX35653.1 hypothetical protein BD324DRAFT_631023 [Kockovaella imperatae]